MIGRWTYERPHWLSRRRSPLTGTFPAGQKGDVAPGEVKKAGGLEQRLKVVGDGRIVLIVTSQVSLGSSRTGNARTQFQKRDK